MSRFVFYLLPTVLAVWVLSVDASICQEPEAPSTVVTTELDRTCETDGLITLREAIFYAAIYGGSHPRAKKESATA